MLDFTNYRETPFNTDVPAAPSLAFLLAQHIDPQSHFVDVRSVPRAFAEFQDIIGGERKVQEIIGDDANERSNGPFVYHRALEVGRLHGTDRIVLAVAYGTFPGSSLELELHVTHFKHVSDDPDEWDWEYDIPERNDEWQRVPSDQLMDKAGSSGQIKWGIAHDWSQFKFLSRYTRTGVDLRKVWTAIRDRMLDRYQECSDLSLGNLYYDDEDNVPRQIADLRLWGPHESLEEESD